MQLTDGEQPLAASRAVFAAASAKEYAMICSANAAALLPGGGAGAGGGALHSTLLRSGRPIELGEDIEIVTQSGALVLRVLDLEPMTKGIVTEATVVVVCPPASQPVRADDGGRKTATTPATLDVDGDDDDDDSGFLDVLLPIDLDAQTARPAGDRCATSPRWFGVRDAARVLIFPVSLQSSPDVVAGARRCGCDVVVSPDAVERLLHFSMPREEPFDATTIELELLGRNLRALVASPAHHGSSCCWSAERTDIVLQCVSATTYRNLAWWLAACNLRVGEVGDAEVTPTTVGAAYVHLVARAAAPLVVPLDTAVNDCALYEHGAVAVNGHARLFATAPSAIRFNGPGIVPQLPRVCAVATAIRLRPVCGPSALDDDRPTERGDGDLRAALRELSALRRYVCVGDVVEVGPLLRLPTAAGAAAAATAEDDGGDDVLGQTLDAALLAAMAEVRADSGAVFGASSGAHSFYVVEDIELDVDRPGEPAASAPHPTAPAHRLGCCGTLCLDAAGAGKPRVLLTEVRLMELPARVFLPPLLPPSPRARAVRALRAFAALRAHLQTTLGGSAIGAPSSFATVLGAQGSDACEAGTLDALRLVAAELGAPLAELDARSFAASGAGGAGASDEETLCAALRALLADTRDEPQGGGGPGPVIIILRHAELLEPSGAVCRYLQAPREHSDDTPNRGATSALRAAIVLLFETADSVKPALTACSAIDPLRVAVPDDVERTAIIDALLPFEASKARRAGALAEQCAGIAGRERPSAHPLSRMLHVGLAVSPALLASWCVGMSFADVCAWIGECAATTIAAAAAAAPRAEAGLPVLSDAACERALKSFQQLHGHDLTSTRLQPVRWSDVGGLEDAKRELLEAIQLPTLHPELFATEGMKRRAGVLLYGPPGCGKTLLAKAVATEMNMNFISVKGPELINMYVGESEKNIRLLFQRARDSSPCVVFFDELDALAPSRGAKGDSGGVMDRIVAQLLAEVDGVGSARSDGSPASVFIVAATNRPDLLDPSLMRPGRFDRLCYLGVPGTKAEQLFAVRALTRKFNLHPDVDLDAVVAPFDFVFTGADFFALCSDAMMLAVEEVVEQLTTTTAPGRHVDAVDEPASPCKAAEPVTVQQRHFLAARAALKPSVTAADLKKYANLRSQFEA